MNETSIDEGLLIARLVFGTLMAAHGGQKLFGWFGGPSISETAAFFESLQFRVTVHWNNGLLSATNGVELPLLYTATALSLALTGPGHSAPLV